MVVYFQSGNWFDVEKFIEKSDFVNKVKVMLCKTKKDIDWWNGEHYYLGESKPVSFGGQDFLSFEVF